MDIDVEHYLRQQWPRQSLCWKFIRRVYSDVGLGDPGPAGYLDRSKWRKIHFGDLEQGDVVIFRVSTVKRHVGLHLGDNAFIHLEDEIGVCVSRYRDPVWWRAFQRGYRWVP